MSANNLKPQDLRIGNHIDFNGMLCIVKEIDDLGVVVDIPETKENEWIDLFQFTAIPLESKWLKKNGFDIKEPEGVFAWKHSPIGDTIMVKCKYVHQFQNLFFALNCEEFIK